jgi:NAD-specific glutamate dehydrogenase
MDRVGIKRYDDKGELIYEDRFLGLFTSAAYSRSVRETMLRLKFKRVLDKAGLDPRSHNGKALVEILESFPRDEFFQITDADLFDIARGILLLQERHRVALFTRRMFSSDSCRATCLCLAIATPDFKERAKQILEQAFDGRDTAIYDFVTDSPLARGCSSFARRAFRKSTSSASRRIWPRRRGRGAISCWRRRAAAGREAASSSIAGTRGVSDGVLGRFSAEAALYDIAHVEEVLDRQTHSRSLSPSRSGSASVPLQDHSRRPARAAVRDHAAARRTWALRSVGDPVRSDAARREQWFASATSVCRRPACGTTSARSS